MVPRVLPALSLGVLAGVAVGSVHVLPLRALVPAAFAVGALCVVPFPNRRIRLVLLACMACVLGIWRGNGALGADHALRAQWEMLHGKPHVFGGVVLEAEERGPFTRLTVGYLRFGETLLSGTVRATVPRGPDRAEGARIHIRGVLEAPGTLRRGSGAGAPARGDLERSFARQRVFGSLQFPVVVVESRGKPSLLAGLRLRLRDVLLHQLPEPAAGLYSAFLLSYDRDLDPDLKERAAASGLLHLVAISGSHIAVLAAFVFFTSTFLGFTRRVATVTTLGLTGAFLFLVGLPESGIRSGLMAGLVGMAYLLGRPAAGLRMLLFASAAMTVVNPRILLGDTGFQLSALAVWGLLAVFPFLRSITRRVPDPLRVKTLFLLTIAAEIGTLPVTAYTFGSVSLIAPLTNLLAVPLFPVLLAVGGLLLLVGIVVPAIAAIPAAVAVALGNTFLAIADLGSRVPFHAVPIPAFSFAVFAASVISLMLLVHLLHGRATRQ